MPLAVDSLKITFGGGLPGNEIWQCGLWVIPGSLPGTQTQLQAYSDNLIPFFTTWWSSTGINTLRSAGVTLNSLSTYRYLAGQTKANGVAHSTIALAANAQSQAMPNQAALVCSLRTISPARNARGRFYIPCTAGGNLVGNNLAAATTNAVATACAALLQSINGGPAPSTDSVVAGTSGSRVTRVIVDSVVDTQRRRRNKTLPTTVGVAGV